MFVTILGLLVVIGLMALLWRGIQAFWMWLGRGESVRRARESELVSDEVKQALAKIDAYQAARVLGKEHEGVPPRLSHEHVRELLSAERVVRDNYLDNLRIGMFQVVMLFFIGSVLGLGLEQVWMWFTRHETQMRFGLVWGPFSPLYGVGATLLTLITFHMRKHKAALWQVFVVSVVLGGALEQVTGWGMQAVMGAVSWDYTYVPGSITKWVAAPFLVFWGIMGVVWYHFVMPALLYGIGEATTRRQVIFVTLLAVYLGLDIFMTLACFARRGERERGIPPENAFEVWVDEHYSDQFMAHRFQNMAFQ